jgi:hypothetical protein
VYTGGQLNASSKNHSALYAVLGILAVAVTRILFRSTLLYDIDSVGFGLALKHFDPGVFQPHPPGYFLYICFGRLLNTVIPDANAAFVALSVAASCGAAIFIYLLTDIWYGRGAARTSILLFLVSPLSWFHGTVALTYIVEAFFSALIGYLCWKVYTGNAKFAVPASAAYALAAGFRPSTGLLLAPLWLISLWKARGAQRLLAVVSALLVVLAWLIPMAQASGGIVALFNATFHLWAGVPASRTALRDPALAVARLVTIAWVFVLCFGWAATFLFARGSKQTENAGRNRFVWIWIAPGLAFFTFIYFLFVNSGYLLVLSPPVFALLADRVHRFLTSLDRPLLRWALIGSGLAANTLFFIFAPLYCSYRSVREFEREMTAVTRDFQSSLNPDTTLIVGFDSHFLGYRHAGYYLPAFVTAQYPEVRYPDGKRVFVMHAGDTRLLQTVSFDRFARFVFFPLPSGSQYSAYIEKIQSELPVGALTVMRVGRTNVLTGPVSILPTLFPSTTAFPRPVYTGLPSNR